MKENNTSIKLWDIFITGEKMPQFGFFDKKEDST
jgi:hypothetical protein